MDDRPFIARMAGRMVDAAIGMLLVMCGAGFIGRQHGATLDVIVGWMFAATVALAVAGFALAIVARVAGRKR